MQRISLAAQVAFAVVLTLAGGLLVRSLASLLDVDPGFRPSGVMAFRVDPAGRLPLAARLPFFNEVLRRVSALPGIDSAALTIKLPMDGRSMGWDAVIPGSTYNPATDSAFGRIVSPRYFRTLGVRVIAGRDFDERDRRETPQVVAINETLARRLSSNPGEAVGATLLINGTRRQVVAVVGDVRHSTLDEASGREVYIPQGQAPAFFQAYDLVIRASDPAALVADIRTAIWSVDRNQAIGEPVTLRALVDDTLRPRRLLTSVLAGFSMAALLLSALGVYGVVGYRIAQRRKELAIRVAIGSPAWRLVTGVMKDALVCTAAGIAVGIPLALAASTALRAYLFGVDARDAAMLTVTCGVVLMAAIAAAYVPARRAPRVDPIAALRIE